MRSLAVSGKEASRVSLEYVAASFNELPRAVVSSDGARGVASGTASLTASIAAPAASLTDLTASPSACAAWSVIEPFIDAIVSPND